MGYSRAVRLGSLVFVAGPPRPGVTTRSVIRLRDHGVTVEYVKGLEAQGFKNVPVEDVVRTRIYVTDISQWEPIGRAHGEVFGTIRPATAMVQVSALISPEMLVEMEADAVVAGS